MRELWHLFAVFFKIGAFTFGGGYAMIPLIEREIIERQRWIAREQFLDLLTLAQSAPGPIALNTSVFVGYKLRGYAGAVAALMGIVVPAFAIILLVAIFFRNVRDNSYVDAAFRGMRPAVVALIVAPIVGLARRFDVLRSAAAAAVALLIWYWGVSPVLFIVAGAAAGLLVTACRRMGKGGRP